MGTIREVLETNGLWDERVLGTWELGVRKSWGHRDREQENLGTGSRGILGTCGLGGRRVLGTWGLEGRGPGNIGTGSRGSWGPEAEESCRQGNREQRCPEDMWTRGQKGAGDMGSRH